MNKFISTQLAFILFASLALAQGVTQRFPSDALQMGRGSNAINKTITVNTGDGVSNPKITINQTTKEFSFSKAVNIAANLFRVGTGAAANQTIEFDIGLGAANPKFRWNNTDAQIEFSNDGTNFVGVGSGGGGGGGFSVLQNGGFEAGTTKFSNSGGTVAVVTSGSNLLFEKKSVTFDASAGSQHFQSDLYDVPVGLYGSMCSAKIYYLGGDTNLTLQVLDGSSNVLAERAFESAATTTRPFALAFSCPASGQFRIRVASTANAAIVALDRFSLGDDTIDVGVDRLPWTSYTPASFQGFGTVTNVDFKYKRIDDMMIIMGTWTNGTVDASEARVSFPPSLTAITLSQVQTAGTFLNSNGSSDNRMNLLLSSGASYLQFGRAGSLAPQSGNTFNSSETMKVLAFVPVAEWAIQSGTRAMRFDTYAWLINSQITGSAAISMATGDQSALVSPSDAGLTLTNKPGSMAAKIACTSTNPATGTTCSAGDEQPGISFDLPAAQDVQICMDFGQELDLTASTNLYGQFTIVETPNNAQTVTQDCGPNVMYGDDGATAARQDIVQTRSFCGVCRFDSAGTKTVRMMYKQELVSGTINVNAMNVHTLGGVTGSALNIVAKPLRQQIPAPLFVSAQEAVLSSAATQTITSTSPTVVTGLSATINAKGRPVSLKLVASGNPGVGAEGVVRIIRSSGNTAKAAIQFLRDGTVIAGQRIEVSNTGLTDVYESIPSSSFAHEDHVGPGTYTYTVRAFIEGSTTAIDIENVKLSVIEH